MKKIKNFQIITLTLTNFKQFAEQKTFRFGTTSMIMGDNGQGKSSIADAIAFAFCGTPFWGDKSSDRLTGAGGDFMCVELGLADMNGTLHTISREKHRNQTNVKFDGVPVRQTDIANIFTEKDIFLSILNPLYFIEKIASDGREFLQKLLPPIKQEDVMALLSDHTRTLIENESLLDPEYYAKNRRERLKEIEDDYIYLDGQLDLLKNQLSGLANASADARRAVSETEDKIKAIKERQFDGIDVDALRKQREEMLAALSDDKRVHAREMLAKAETRVYESKFAGEIAKMEMELKSLYALLSETNGKLESFRSRGTCPLCFIAMSEDEAAEPIKLLSDQIVAIVHKGKEQKKALDELKALEQQAIDTFDKFKADDIERWKAELESIPSVDPSDISMLDETLKNGKLSDSEFNDLQALEIELIADKAAVRALPNEKSLKEGISNMEQSLKKIEDEKKTLQHLIAAAVDYAAKRAELTLAPLKMNRAEIKLMDVAKTTGEIKNIFRFTFDGKDYRWLSTSEKIRAGLEVSDLLRRLTGCNYPTFIDNAECITSMQRPRGQALLAYVKKGAVLTVQTNETANREAA